MKKTHKEIAFRKLHEHANILRRWQFKNIYGLEDKIIDNLIVEMDKKFEIKMNNLELFL